MTKYTFSIYAWQKKNLNSMPKNPEEFFLMRRGFPSILDIHYNSCAEISASNFLNIKVIHAKCPSPSPFSAEFLKGKGKTSIRFFHIFFGGKIFEVYYISMINFKCPLPSAKFWKTKEEGHPFAGLR